MNVHTDRTPSAALNTPTPSKKENTSQNPFERVAAKASSSALPVLLHLVTGGISTSIAIVVMTKAQLSNLQSLYNTSASDKTAGENTVKAMLKTSSQRVESDKAINETPQARHDPQKMIDYLCARHGKAAVEETLKKLEEKDPRFNNADPRFSFDSGALKTALDSKTSETTKSTANLTSGVEDAESHEQPETLSHPAAVVKDITNELVAFVKRAPTVLTFATDSSKGLSWHQTVVIQTYGHVTHNADESCRFEKGKTPSAELPNNKQIDNVVNQGSIKFKDGENGREKVLMCRSGRTDSSQKIIDKSLGDIMARLETKGKNDDDPCLKKVRDNNGNQFYTYRRVDNTLMDSSLLKSKYTEYSGSLLNLGTEKPVESELMFINNKKNAIAETWDEKKNPNKAKKDESGRVYIEHKIEHNGESVTVREYKPIVNQYVFSGQSKLLWNLKSAREANQGSTIEMGSLLAKDLRPKGSTEESELEKKFTACLGSPNSNSKKSALAEEIKKVITDENNSIDKKDKMVLLGIYASLTGTTDLQKKVSFSQLSQVKNAAGDIVKTLSGKSPDSSEDSVDTIVGAAQQYLFASLLADRVGCAFGAECKSGNDRTATAMALKCAQEEYSSTHPDEPLDIMHVQENNDFKELFVKYIIALAIPNVMASRGAAPTEEGEQGKPILKTGGHPIFGIFAKDDKGEWLKVSTSRDQTTQSVDDVATLI